MPSAPIDGLELRPWSASDLDGAVDLLRATREEDADGINAGLLRWKHFENPFGSSPGWVACDDEGRIVGLRIFVRWELSDGGRVVRAARAVDTAVHPQWQRRGLFTELTQRSLATLRDDGVEVVFNTPNDKSRPGYLKMGWKVVGQLTPSASPCRASGLAKILRARTPARRASVSTQVGTAAPSVSAQTWAGLIPPPVGDGVLRTNRTAPYLAWRYGLESLQYRLWQPGPPGVGVVFRLRNRGPAVEATVCEILVADPQSSGSGAGWRAARQAGGAAGADYAVVLGRRPKGLALFAPLLCTGPMLTCLALSGPQRSRPAEWDLHLGDIELF